MMTEEVLNASDKSIEVGENKNEKEKEEENTDSEVLFEDSDDGEGWITAENIHLYTTGYAPSINTQCMPPSLILAPTFANTNEQSLPINSSPLPDTPQLNSNGDVSSTTDTQFSQTTNSPSPLPSSNIIKEFTPSNYSQLSLSQPQPHETPPLKSSVFLISSDFAVQNVAIQMGLSLLSISLRRITQARSFLLQCPQCFTIEKKLDRKFCGECGLPGLIRVGCAVDDSTGEMHVFDRRFYRGRKQISMKGNVYSIPIPKGGRGGRPLVLREDVYLERIRKTRRRIGHKDPRRGEGGDPLGNKHNPEHSVVIGFGRRNPNAPKHFFPSKKRHNKR